MIKALKNLKKSKLHKDAFKSFFDNSQEGCLISDLENRIIDINPAFEKISGHKRNKVIGKSLTDYIPESFHETLSIRLKELDTHLSVELGEYKIFDKSGSIKIVEASSVIIPYKSDKAVLSIIRDTTERKKIELELITAKEKAEKNETKLKEAQELAMIGNWELDLLNNNLFWSDQIYKIFDCKPQQFTATYDAFLNFIHPEDRDFVDNAYKAHIQTKLPYDIVHRIQLSNGVIKYVNERCRSDFDDNGKPIRSIGTVADITSQIFIENELKAAKEKAEENQNRYKLLSDLALEGVALHKGGVILDANMAFCNIFGRMPDEIIGVKNPGSILFPSESRSLVRYNIEHGVTEPYRVKGKKKDGTEIWVEIEARNYTYRNDQVRVTTFHDITKKREHELELIKAKEKAAESEERYKLLSDLALEGVALHKGGVVINANMAFCNIFGRTPDEIIGINPIPVLFPSESINLITYNIEHGVTAPYRVKGKKKDETEIWVEIEARNYTYRNEQIRVVALRDITKKREHELELIKAKETALKEKLFSENLIRSLPAMFYLAELKDNGAHLLKWNDNYEKETQYSSDELNYKNMLDFFCEDELEEVYNLFKKLAEGQTINAILNPIIKDGSRRRYLFQAVGFEENGKNYYLGTGIDITEKRDLERKLIESVIQTEESERRRIASDLHDGLGPELSAIKLYIQGLIDSASESEKNEIGNKLMELIDHSIDNISEISFNISPHILLDYGLVEAINYFINKLRIKPDIEITTHFDKIERFDINEELTLYRTISELFNNTLKYADATNIKLEIKITNRAIHIYYADNGKGFSVEHELEKKKGMGIQNMIGRIKSLEGTIKMQSKINEGMSVAIHLPYILKDE